MRWRRRAQRGQRVPLVSTFGLPLESKVNEFVPLLRASAGTAMRREHGAQASTIPGISSRKGGNACLVVTDEVGKGKERCAASLETDESLMHRGHDLWLATLKWTSEGK